MQAEFHPRFLQNKPVSDELQLCGPTKLHQSLFNNGDESASGKNRIRETSKRSRVSRILQYLLSFSHRKRKLSRHVALTSRLFYVTSLELTMAYPAPISNTTRKSANVCFRRVPDVTHLAIEFRGISEHRGNFALF